MRLQLYNTFKYLLFGFQLIILCKEFYWSGRRFSNLSLGMMGRHLKQSSSIDVGKTRGTELVHGGTNLAQTETNLYTSLID